MKNIKKYLGDKICNMEVKYILKQKWKLLEKKNIDYINSKYPGVYVIAWSDNETLIEKYVLWEDIYYIGMSNAKAGVQGRLKQFSNGITNGIGHSAANRWYREINRNESYKLENKQKFYFAYILIDCNVHKENRSPHDLRKMGEVTKLEYELMSLYKENVKNNFNNEPEGNKK